MMKPERDAKLWSHAGLVFPHNEQLREKWYNAVTYLRQSKKGWTLDKMVAKTVDRPLLHGYVATPPVQTVTTLPDAQVVPWPKQLP